MPEKLGKNADVGVLKNDYWSRDFLGVLSVTKYKNRGETSIPKS